MTTVSIRISTTSSGPSTPASGLAGAFGGRVPGASDDTSVEVTIEDLDTMGDALVAIEGALPAAATAFIAATGNAPAPAAAESYATNPWDTAAEPLIDAEVLDGLTMEAAGVDERAEKKRRKARRKRAVTLITPMVRDAYTSGMEWDEDAKEIVKALENEGIIR